MNTELQTAIQKSIGERMRAIRLKKGLRQNEVAELCGFYRTGYNSIELGLRNVSLINIYKIAFALEEPISSFFDNEEFKAFFELYENERSDG